MLKKIANIKATLRVANAGAKTIQFYFNTLDDPRQKVRNKRLNDIVAKYIKVLGITHSVLAVDSSTTGLSVVTTKSIEKLRDRSLADYIIYINYDRYTTDAEAWYPEADYADGILEAVLARELIKVRAHEIGEIRDLNTRTIGDEIRRDLTVAELVGPVQAITSLLYYHAYHSRAFLPNEREERMTTLREKYPLTQDLIKEIGDKANARGY